LAAVRKAYGEIDLSFNAEEKQIPDIIDRLTALTPSAAPASCRCFRPTSSW
jgi:hypothetical protein